MRRLDRPLLLYAKQFREFVLRLLFNGNNGDTTTIDASGYNANVILAGSAQISTAQSEEGGSSLSLNGTSDYASVADAPRFDFGDSDFTLRLWVSATTLSAPGPFYALLSKTDSDSNAPWRIHISDKNLNFLMRTASGTAWQINEAMLGRITAGTPFVVEVCRFGNNITLRLDGVCVFLDTWTGSIWANSAPVQIGAISLYSTPSYFPGYIDNLYIKKGIADYTGGLSTPAFSTVVLQLPCTGTNGSTTVTDESTLGKVVTLNGGMSISTAFDAGGTLYFDGVNDYATVPVSSVEYDLSKDFTIEFSFKPDNATSGNGGILHLGFYTAGGTNTWTRKGFSIRKLGSFIRFYYYATVSADEQYNDVTIPDANEHHYRISKCGSGVQVHLDGVRVAGIDPGLGSTVKDLLATTSTTLRIGLWDYSAGNEFLAGHLRRIRITNGFARSRTAKSYTPSFPYPTS